MKNFKQKLHNFIEKILIEDSKYLDQWLAEDRAVYCWNGYSGDEVSNWEDYYKYLFDIFSHKKKRELCELIAELHEYVNFTEFDCRLFSRLFTIKLNVFVEDYPVLICENKQFQDWVFTEIINYLR